jgi:GNAT superfamily N-acetyltransferase
VGVTDPRPGAVTDIAAADDATVADLLARAFWDDPLFRWLLPGERWRYARMCRFFRAEVGSVRRRGRVLTTPDLEGAALWAAPGRWRSPPTDVFRYGPGLALSLGFRLPEVARAMGAVEQRHPAEPHWYLATLGTDPNRQGRGVAGRLLAEVLDQCDEGGLPAYLEASRWENVAFYRRFRFAETDEIALTSDGPRIWPMWRDPA